jgi:hypothetical protein
MAVPGRSRKSSSKAAVGPPWPDVGQLARSPLYSEELGINLSSGRDKDYFLWFLASLLFGARISETIAGNTYRVFVRYGLKTPRKILDAGWDFLVDPVMREGGYVRYDGRKSDQVLRDCEMLLDTYGGRLSRLETTAADGADLEARLDAFYGVGPVTVNIFLRELRPWWPKANPEPLPAVTALAQRLNIDLHRHGRKSQTFARIEAGLIRLRQRKGVSSPSKSTV